MQPQSRRRRQRRSHGSWPVFLLAVLAWLLAPVAMISESGAADIVFGGANIVFGADIVNELGGSAPGSAMRRVLMTVALAMSALSLLFGTWQLFKATRLRNQSLRLSGRPQPTTTVTRVGVSLWRFADFVYSQKTFRLVFEPILLDLLHEHREALERGSRGKARWVLIRGYWSFWSAVVAQVPVSLTRLLVKLWKVSGPGG